MKKAFTMLEMVFVIVIIGIISILAVPNLQNNNLRLAANQLISHIRYTQHLAMMDNQFNPDDINWSKKRWQMQFHSTVSAYDISWSYSIYKDTSLSGNPNSKKELAKNPVDNTKLLSGGFGSLAADYEDFTKSMMLGNSYGISDIVFEGGCKYYTSRRVAFNFYGVPYYGNLLSTDNQYDRRLAEQCRIVLCIENSCTNATDDQKITIAIEPETGYTHIL